VDAGPGLCDLFLERLVTLAIREAATAQPGERRALGEALFSTFLDCTDLGLAEQAYRIFAFVHPQLGPVEVGGDGNDAAGRHQRRPLFVRRNLDVP
jgi:hypothetical protein